MNRTNAKTAGLVVSSVLAGMLLAIVAFAIGHTAGADGYGHGSPAMSYFSLDGSGNVVCAAPLQVTRLGVGVAPGSYTGTIKQAVNANDGSVKAIEQAWSGTPGESSDAMIWNGTYGIGGTGVSFAIKSYANEIRNYVGTGAPTFTYGLATADGYGISVGGTAPTTNALTIKSGTTQAAPSGFGLLSWDDTNKRMFFQDSTGSGGGASFVCKDITCQGKIRVNDLAEPSNAPSNCVYLYLDSTTGQASVKGSDGTVEAVTSTMP